MSAGDKKQPLPPNQLNHYLDCFTELDGKIRMELRTAQASLNKWIIDTREAAIHNALINLGWTPPGEMPATLKEAAARGKECGCRYCYDCSAYWVVYPRT